jgi:hypothetical protein
MWWQLRRASTAMRSSPGGALVPWACIEASLSSRLASLSIPYKLGTLAYKLEAKAGSRACDHTLPRISQGWARPPHSGGLRWCHTSRGSGPYLPAREGSGTTTRLMAPNHASLSRRAPELPSASRLWTPPPHSAWLRCLHGTCRYLCE